jgi:hypothetical protein
MKPKNFSKRLLLNKKTVANLNQKSMSNVKGGGTGITCEWCNSDASCMVTKCDWDETEYTGCDCTDVSCGIYQCDFNTHRTICC